MKQINSLSFLQGKIQGIGSALFYSLGTGVLKFPTSIVSTLKVDEAGNIWFFISKPGQKLQEFDWEFPAKMQFYRKGKGYCLQVTGKACVVNDPEEVNGLVSLSEEMKTEAFKECVLMKVRINNAEYYDFNETLPRNNLMGLLTRIYSWLFHTRRPSTPYVLQPSTGWSYN
jgi:hypothetical protein